MCCSKDPEPSCHERQVLQLLCLTCKWIYMSLFMPQIKYFSLLFLVLGPKPAHASECGACIYSQK